jgi:hypothetical protein
MDVPSFRATGENISSWIKPIPGEPLAFRTSGQVRDVKLIPFYKTFGERYSIYWSVA